MIGRAFVTNKEIVILELFKQFFWHLARNFASQTLKQKSNYILYFSHSNSFVMTTYLSMIFGIEILKCLHFPFPFMQSFQPTFLHFSCKDRSLTHFDVRVSLNKCNPITVLFIYECLAFCFKWFENHRILQWLSLHFLMENAIIVIFWQI